MSEKKEISRQGLARQVKAAGRKEVARALHEDTFLFLEGWWMEVGESKFVLRQVQMLKTELNYG